MSEYLRGSEWRRWDLHIHTPETIKNDQFAGNSKEEKWDMFYSDIKNYVGDGVDPTKNITVIGITDYLSIDNYQRVIADNKLPNNIKLVLPNVEMRMYPLSKKNGINIHFIFDPLIANELNERFFSQLYLEHGGRKYTAVKSGLIALGKAISPELDEVPAYNKGVGQFIPAFKTIKDIFDSDNKLREKTIIIVSNSSNDGVTGASNHSCYFDSSSQGTDFDATRQSIYQFTDAIFSANETDIKYFLGQGTDIPKVVINKCGALKPCVHGSDAHKNPDIFEPDDKKYCWIKADPTFNGLRQVLYEPKERVRISTIKPETKTDYYVIDRVEIDDQDFQKQPIYFNDKLNCIIGGKSTGKSILLHNLALSIDKKQVEEKIKLTHANIKILPGFKTYWLDGEVSSPEKIDNDHKIVYIPQTYLNRLSDANEEVTEIDSIIQDIVLINDKAKETYDGVVNAIKEYKPILAKKIYDVIQIYSEISKLINDKKELGTSNGIIKEIEKLKSQKDALSKELSLSNEEVEKYDNAVNKLRELSQKLDVLQTDIAYISLIDTLVEPKSFTFDLSDGTMKFVEIAKEKALIAAASSWVNSKIDIIRTLEEEKARLLQDIVEFKKIEQELHDKIAGNEAINKLSNAIQNEEIKLIEFNKLDLLERSQKEALERLIDTIAESIEFYRSQHKKYFDAVNYNTELKCSDLEFSVDIPFRSDAFCNFLKSLFDNRFLKSKRNIVDVDNFKPEGFSKGKIKILIYACLNGDLPLVKNNTIETALRGILDDWFNTTYSVKMDNDSIELMSPGKKALVLLKLLINLADSKCPILIDQPEDDLDNRSVFDDLIPFIREKKVSRQIIVVTHNANVVVGGDAEVIIVANQNGNNAKNKKFRFEYRSGPIEDDLPLYELNGDVADGILNQQGIQHHICDILEGGEIAFDLRKNKYHI